ncbi:hypothetical protein ILUMI_01234 [Ignelater luminosus]|uniref:HTH psq-type domain-containing protein n=1 Tax=Ignelater luminosus TaxID=2038154 RepID=A0A8K0DKN7_IGNLU|nr:hypothetical protein ILUMI_01234 [Ignelater luminosus]
MSACFRKYVDYTPETLKQFLAAIKSGMRQRVAAEAYNIPRRTLNNKLKQKHAQKPGYPPVFTADEEASFVSCIYLVSTFGFPVDEFELQCDIQAYLRRQDRKPRKKKRLQVEAGKSIAHEDLEHPSTSESNDTNGEKQEIRCVRRHPQLS